MRKPTNTVRIDIDSHAELRRLAQLYASEWKRHVSIADVVRMGITVLHKDYELRRYGGQHGT